MTTCPVNGVLINFFQLSIQCFSVVQPETRFHFQSANQIAKKGQNFQKFHIKFQNFTKISKNLNQNFHKIFKQNSLSFNNSIYLPKVISPCRER
jgi:hypothetical protein